MTTEERLLLHRRLFDACDESPVAQRELPLCNSGQGGVVRHDDGEVFRVHLLYEGDEGGAGRAVENVQGWCFKRGYRWKKTLCRSKP